MWLNVCSKARKAVFSVEYGQGVPLGLWMIDLDGKNLRQLARPNSSPGDARFPVHPGMSPDGEQVVYSSTSHDPNAESTGQVSRLEILNVKTGQVRRLTDELEDDHPSWSPNGDWIVYTHYWRADRYRQPRRIWLIRPDGSENKPVMGGFDPVQMRLNDTKELFAWFPSWSHDGKWISAWSGGSFLFVVDAALGRAVLYKHALLGGKDIPASRVQVGKKVFLCSGLSVWGIVAPPPTFEITQVIDRLRSALVPSPHFGDLSTDDLRWGNP